MSKKKIKIIIPHYGFREKYLTWQLGNCSASTAHFLGVTRFIIFVIVLTFMILTMIYLPHLLGYGKY
jgi:hypothetical protein